MTVYADMLFLVNFIMNGLVLFIVKKIFRRPQKIRWLLGGAGLMALLYTFLIIFEPLRVINIALASAVILAAGLGLAFHPFSMGALPFGPGPCSGRAKRVPLAHSAPNPRRSGEQSPPTLPRFAAAPRLARRFLTGIKSFLKLMAAGYAIAFTVGGLGMALFFLTDIPYALYFIAADWDGFTRTVSWQLALAGAAISYCVFKAGLKLAEHYTLKRQMLCNVQVFLGGEGCSFDALVDTGHSLKEPISQSPVIIAEFELMKNFLPDGLKILFYEKQENNLAGILNSREGAFYRRIRMIPFTSVGRANGMLIGFRPDRVTVEGASCPPADVVIGIYNDTLCRDGRYRGLVSPDLVA